ncbi:hypothetical protein SAMN04487926_113143 [Paraburkholderia steynii]|uniref:Uncharacterized protein n=1 Tax=Paraburkholderia steynii TaxID=1245441 RepID=A0A7Z7B8X9_9BURK|nr:hypothetical protein SAMN04487926_113143 [Paraburkholderia steynii]
MVLISFALLFRICFSLGRLVENKIHTLDQNRNIGWRNVGVPW